MPNAAGPQYGAATGRGEGVAGHFSEKVAGAWRGRRRLRVQHRPEPGAELPQVQAVDRAAAVEVQVVLVPGVPPDGAERRPEEAEVQPVDRPVAVDVAEQP